MSGPSRAPGTVRAPAAGLWRVGQRGAPLASRPPSDDDPRGGSRFDDPRGEYGVVYLARDPVACFGEVLAPLRVDPELAASLAPEDPVGLVTPGWRERRMLIRASVPRSALFLDLEAPQSVQALRREIGWALPALGLPDLDIGVLRGAERRITRIVSAWAHAREGTSGRPVYAGIRYLSRLNSAWECFAVFERTEIREVERREISGSNAALVEVAGLYGLHVV